MRDEGAGTPVWGLGFSRQGRRRVFWDVLGLGYIGCQGESLVRREQGLYSGLRVCYLRQGARLQDLDFGFKVEGLAVEEFRVGV